MVTTTGSPGSVKARMAWSMPVMTFGRTWIRPGSGDQPQSASARAANASADPAAPLVRRVAEVAGRHQLGEARPDDGRHLGVHLRDPGREHVRPVAGPLPRGALAQLVQSEGEHLGHRSILAGASSLACVPSDAAPNDAAPPPRLVLASASPARLRLLRQAGIEPEVVVSGVDEDSITGLPPTELVCALAVAKATAVAERLRRDGREGTLVLGADSMFEIDGVLLGKPGTAEAGDGPLAGDAGRVRRPAHRALRRRRRGPGERASGTASTVVTFADVSDDEIAAYVASGEPLEVAGRVHARRPRRTVRRAGRRRPEQRAGPVDAARARARWPSLGVRLVDLWA